MVTEQTRLSSLSFGSESIATRRTTPYVENTESMAFSSIAGGTPATRNFVLPGSNKESSSGQSVERKISAAPSSAALSSALAATVARFSDLNESTAAPPRFSRNRTETISVDDTIPEPYGSSPLSPLSQCARIASSSFTSDGSGATSTWISPPSSSSSSARGGASVAGGGGGTSVVAPSAVCSVSAGGGGTSVVPSAAAGGEGTSCVAAGGAGTSRGGAGTSRSAGASAAPGASAAREATSSSRRARSAGLVPVVSSPASSSRPRISPTFSALRAFSVSGISIGSRSGRRGDVVARQTMTAKPCARVIQ
mmetsp:Transcript_13013/g.54634  ORF Transcript_13013/g.54634 Transcript_13013/m.54634 type:complete len:309 (-) Transcript_13013:3534-4460(-)